MNRYSTLFAVLIALVAGCGQPAPANNGGDTGRLVQRLLIEFDQRLVLPTSVLTFRVKGSDRMVPRAAQVAFEGSSLGRVNLCTIRDTEIAALENPRKKRKKKPGAKP